MVLSIAQLRQKEIEKLSDKIGTADAQKEAAYIMHSFYRLAGLYYNSFLISNDKQKYKLYGGPEAVKKLDARIAAWHRRLNNKLKNYDLKIVFPGLYPHIETLNGYNFINGTWYNRND